MSDEAILPCGTVFRNDLVILGSNHIAKVLRCWHSVGTDGNHVQLQLYAPVAGMPLRWSKTSHFVIYDVCEIVEAVAYYVPSPESEYVVVAMPVV